MNEAIGKLLEQQSKVTERSPPVDGGRAAHGHLPG